MFEPFEIGADLARRARVAEDTVFLIAGPCVLESEDHALFLAREIGERARRLAMPVVFKASFDKANRTALEAYRGPGLAEGLRILARVRREIGLPILTDIHEPAQAAPAAEVADVLQIPAFLCRQTDLIAAAARTGKPVNIKKGQFVAPQDIAHAAEKARGAGAKHVILTERGASFGYNNLVVDMRALVEMAKLGYPVVFDATHSVQIPGGAGNASGGRREFIEPLIRGAAGVGVQGVFVEVHEAPERAKSDGPNALPLERLEAVIRSIQRMDAARRDIG